MLSQIDIDKQFKKILNKVKNYHDAEEVLGESLLAISKIEKKTKINNSQHLLNKIVYFKIKDYYRFKKNNKIEFIKDYQVYIDKDEDLYLIDIKTSLSENEYEIMMLYYGYGYNYDKLCRIFKLKRGELARILRRIKSEMLQNC